MNAMCSVVSVLWAGSIAQFASQVLVRTLIKPLVLLLTVLSTRPTTPIAVAAKVILVTSPLLTTRGRDLVLWNSVPTTVRGLQTTVNQLAGVWLGMLAASTGMVAILLGLVLVYPVRTRSTLPLTSSKLSAQLARVAMEVRR